MDPEARSAAPILVLGASGFLGAHLAAAAATTTRPVLGASPRPSRVPERVDRARVELQPWDAAVAGATVRLLRASEPVTVINAAALSRVAACEHDPELAGRLNAELPELVGRLTRASGTRLVHVSTDLVFGGEPPRPAGHGEGDPVDPLHVYGRTKAEGEERLLEANPEALVVRLPLLYGDSDGRGLGASDALRAALARGARPTLFTDEWRTPLEVSNAARALLELADTGVHGILHVAGPERLSRLELGIAILASAGVTRADALAQLGSCTRAEAGCGDRPADVSLAAGRARTLLGARGVELLAPTEGLRAAASA